MNIEDLVDSNIQKIEPTELLPHQAAFQQLQSFIDRCKMHSDAYAIIAYATRFGIPIEDTFHFDESGNVLANRTYGVIPLPLRFPQKEYLLGKNPIICTFQEEPWQNPRTMIFETENGLHRCRHYRYKKV